MEEKEQLSSLANDLEGILKKARSWAPQEAGVIIQNPQVKKNSKTISKKKHQKKNGEQKANLKTLRTRAYGRPKHPYTSRVGKHAEIMKKNFKVHVPLAEDMPKKRCSTKPDIVDLCSPNKKPCNHPPRKPWVCLSNLTLYQADKKELTSGNLLNDNHINAAQFLLKNQFSQVDGLIDTLIVSNKLTREDATISMTNAIQIHNLPGHWVVSQSNGHSVIVYDSLFPGMTQPLSQQLVYVYKSLAKGCLLQVKLRCCQKQDNFVDCGLFAIANAVALAKGIYPGAVIFRQNQMLQHLLQCLEQKEITMFPHDMKNQPCHIRERSIMIKC